MANGNKIATLLALALFGIGAPEVLADADDESPAVMRDDAAQDNDDQTVGGEADDEEGVETEDLFGFTEGASTDEAGESEISITTVLGAGRRGIDDEGDEPSAPIDYTGVEAELEVEHALTDRLKVGADLAFTYYDTRFEDEFDNQRFDFGGLSAEMKFALLKADDALPVNVAITVEGEWERSSEESGDQLDGFGLSVGLLGDATLVPDRLFVAANLVLSTETGEPEEAGEAWEKESGIDLSLALSYQVAPRVFIGTEARLSNAFEGGFADYHQGYAVFAGPTAYVGIGERGFIKAAWSNQLFGHSDDDAGKSLDLVDFTQNVFRIGGGVSF